MTEHHDVAISKKNRKKAISLIPVKLIQQEEKLLVRIQASKKKPLAKLNYLFDFMSEISKPFQHLTPCKTGCSHCCNIRVDVSELEVFNIKKYAKNASKNRTTGLAIGDPCPFLKNNTCSIYEFRPFVCRRHQVFTPSSDLCSPEQDTGQELLAFSEVDKSFNYILSEYGSVALTDIRTHFS